VFVLFSVVWVVSLLLVILLERLLLAIYMLFVLKDKFKGGLE